MSPQLKRLLVYAKPYSPRLVAGVLLLGFVAIAEGLTAFLVTPAVDQVLHPSVTVSNIPLFKIPWNEEYVYLNRFFPPSIHNVWTIFAITIVVVFVARAIAEYTGVTEIQYTGHAATRDLRNAVYEKVLRQPIGFFQKNPTGRVLSTVINDVEKTRMALGDYLADLFQKSFTFVVLVMVMLITNWKMTVAAAFLVPLVVLPVGKLGRKIRTSVEKSQTRLGDLSQIVEETVGGNRVVKAFGMEDFEIRRFREVARRMLRESMRWVRAYALTSPLMDLLGGLVIPLVLLYARGQIQHNQMTPGQFFTFLFAMFNAYMPLKRMGYVYQQFQAAKGASVQLFSYLELVEENLDVPAGRNLPAFSGEIEFQNVGFAYDRESAPVLQNIQFTARKGEVIALVGSSGAGKTTLVNLLARFYEVSSGAIKVDGRDIREVTIRSLREQIAMVTQENILFHDTVRNNICYGMANVPQEGVVEAAKAALAHDFIQELPQGYDTVIGARGTRLSGGQRQRIAIARAILKDSPILILDEATSELDSESELYVQKALSNLMVGRTTFVIAHRLGTVRKADKILVLDNGHICESGTHGELLARNGSYARLHELQFADEEMLAEVRQPNGKQAGNDT